MTARELIAEIIRRDAGQIPDVAKLAHIDGWDSIKGVRLVLRLEELSGRELSEDDIAGLDSLSDVERILRSGA